MMLALIAASVIYTIGPLPKAKVTEQVVSDTAALRQIVWEDSTNQIVPLNVLWGDMNGDGRISNADIVYLKNYVLLKGPAPKSLLIAELLVTGKDTVTVKYIIVDSAGVMKP